MAKIKCWTWHATFQLMFFHTCHAYRHYWLLPLRIIFTDLDHGWGSQGQRKAKHVAFTFSHTSQLIRIKFYDTEAIQVEHLDTIFEWDLVKQGKYLLFHCVKKNQCWHMHICGSTWHDDIYYCTLYFDTSLTDLDLNSRSQECEKTKTSEPISPKVFIRFRWNCVYYWCLLLW